MNLILQILENLSLYLPAILSLYIALIMLRVSLLSLESAYVLGALITSIIPDLIGYNSLGFNLFFGFFSGAIAGLTSYTLKKNLNISYLLSSILTTGLFHGLNQYIIGGSHISLYEKTKILYALKSFNQYPQLTTIMAISSALLLFFYFFTKTEIGRACMIFGNNNNFFKNYKINSDYIELFGILLSAGLAGIAGFLQAYSSGYADISMGSGNNMLGITIIILGLSFIQKKYHSFIASIGIVAYFLLQKILLTINFNSKYFISVQALTIILLIYFNKSQKKGDEYEIGL